MRKNSLNVIFNAQSTQTSQNVSKTAIEMEIKVSKVTKAKK